MEALTFVGPPARCPVTARAALAALLALLAAPASAQTDAERLQGYALRGDTTVFVFDAGRYGVQTPDRVVVTGAFRAWSADMDDPAWRLAPGPGGVWTLAVPNPEFSVVGAASPFKFRVDDARGPGRWLDPAPGATNVDAGNLIFLFGVTPPRLVAELRGPTQVWVRVTGAERPLTADHYRVVRWDSTEVPVALVTPHEAETALLTLGQPLDPDQVHFVEAGIPLYTKPLRAMARFDGLWRTMASDKPLGATVVRDAVPGSARLRSATHVRLFAPRADSVRVFLYADRSGRETESHALARDADGVWEVAFPDRDLHGTWYDFGVYGPDGPGSRFTTQTGRRVTDPYALVSDDSFGRSRVWRDDFAPPAPLPGGRPPMEDVVAYEVHVQDFTDRLPVADDLRGTLPAMHAAGLRNAAGEPVGIDFVERLGVNVLHLMPVQEFLHYPDSTWQAAFADDPFMQAMGIATENYQWGYRTTHALAIENRFRRHGTDFGAEREQFRDLVDAYHRRGIAVIVDLVFNHTGENMEGQDWPMAFNGTDRHYFYRLDATGAHIGVFGNETKSENRPMMQRWLLDQCRQLVETFGVDGFRIDLAGQTDEQTLRWLRANLPADLIWYGEPWIASADPDYEANPSWDWYKVDSPITFFQDDARNAFKGPTEPVAGDAVASRGFAGGDGSRRDIVMRGIANAFPDEATPNLGINYLDIHDNWALADQFATCVTGECAFDGRQGVDEAAVRIAATLLFTGLGPVVINGGTEILRSKGAAPTREQMGGQRVLATAMSPIYVNGRGDTYNLRVPNQYDWETVGRATGPVDHAAMEAWWRSLIALRRSPAGAVLRVGAEPVPEGYVRFVTPADERALGWMVADRILVMVNAGDAAVEMAADLPVGTWRLYAASDRAGGRTETLGLGDDLGGGARLDVTMPPQSVRIWVRR